ncbi:MAG: DNA-directed RNA polymerase subunit beta' [Christensenellaceae bacterium]|jgi:DNA-directed RNA polymerase subunit beta'|nr:DNA-directed RNA polymerase subunit beta' [Christensenellaceae bacterium]
MEINSFDSIQISLASPDKIREWSYGEVQKPETINYRTQKPERDGLFCERIFGPTKDFECHCGKYKRVRYRGIVCDKCGVEVTRAKVRRERMGHIELAAPVSHIWYFKGVPSRLSMMLDMSPKHVEQVIYFAAFVVLDPGETELHKKDVLRDDELREMREQYGAKAFKVGMGAESLKILLREIDVEEESAKLKVAVLECSGAKRAKIAKRLDVIESFRVSGNKPEWMILDVLPVIPPEIRPMVQLDGGRFATSDLNDLYRRVINRNNRLKKMIESNAPDIVVRNEKRMLQDAVDALIDNGRHGKAVTGPGNRNLKSLSDMLRGKQGRFRQNLLGKRVDYSGRSVIVVGPELKLYQCGLPKEMALELFKPFLFRKLLDRNICQNIKSARRAVDRAKPIVWDILEEVIKDHPVLLNRAPTLHRLGIQAFEPVLVEGRAIKLHPLVCSAFNADFDGDQMAVHVPLSIASQVEARFLMLSTNNILKLSDGKPIVSPTQDMVIGAYYLTQDKEGAKGEGRMFSSPDEAKMAYQLGQIELQARIKVRLIRNIEGSEIRKIVPITVGKILFNEAIPQDLGFVPRETKEDMMNYEIDFLVGKKQLSQIVERCFKLKGSTAVAAVLDKIKVIGFKYSTIGAVTASVFDMQIPSDKGAVLEEAEKAVLEREKQYMRGLLTNEERYNETVSIWKDATDKVEKHLEENFKNFDKFNPIWMMADSGARGSMQQVKQLSGMRGLMSDPTGKVIEIPVKSSFREGLSVLEYFISSHGARKGGADTALKTADSGYLTRRLVDVAHDVIIKEIDCEDSRGFVVRDIVDAVGRKIEGLEERIAGRYALKDVVDPETGEIIVAADNLIDEDLAKKVAKAGVKEVTIRSILTCKAKQGVCAKCYGVNMSSWNVVKLGEAVGIIAAQSIGEPGTQLTMRTFHTGGVASGTDITQGLPRVVELFEARKPKGEAIITDIKGVVSITKDDTIIDEPEDVYIVTVTSDDETCVASYKIPRNAKIIVTNEQLLEAGDPITVGSISPQDILRTKGVHGVQESMIREVQAAYRSNGVHINDKHIEVIVRQMLRKVRISDPKDTNLLMNELVEINRIEEENERVLEENGMPAMVTRVLLGISKAALATASFLSAASFQETARVLTDAAIKAKTDNLVGLKENVIIGKLIPAGTGLKDYRNINVERVGTPAERRTTDEYILAANADETFFDYGFDDYAQ